MAFEPAGAALRLSWLRDVQVFANLLREEIDDLSMAWDGRRFLRAAIYVDRVIAAFAQELAAMVFKMLN